MLAALAASDGILRVYGTPSDDSVTGSRGVYKQLHLAKYGGKSVFGVNRVQDATRRNTEAQAVLLASVVLGYGTLVPGGCLSELLQFSYCAVANSLRATTPYFVPAALDLCTVTSRFTAIAAPGLSSTAEIVAHCYYDVTQLSSLLISQKPCFVLPA